MNYPIKFISSISIALFCLLNYSCKKDNVEPESTNNPPGDFFRKSGYIKNYCDNSLVEGVSINYSLACESTGGFCNHPKISASTNSLGIYAFPPDAMVDIIGGGISSADYGSFYNGTDYIYQYVYDNKYYFPDTIVVHPFVTRGINIFPDSSFGFSYIISVGTHAINPLTGEMKYVGSQVSESSVFNTNSNLYVTLYHIFTLYGGIQNQFDITFSRNNQTHTKSVVFSISCNPTSGDLMIYY